MRNYEKPHLGTTPSFIVIPRRIIDLAAAISRYADDQEIASNKEVTGVIRMWASEIIGHCDTLDKIQDVK